MEDQRSHAKLMLAEILIGAADQRSQICPNMCKWAGDCGYGYLRSLEKARLQPTDIRCISRAIETVEEMNELTPSMWKLWLDNGYDREGDGDCENTYEHSTPEYRKSVCDELYRLDYYGLCLHCVRSGRTNSAPCRDMH
jgi:hypothetical protein